MNEELFDKLKSASDIESETHDGSYKLVQKTVEAYATMDSLNSVDYKDFELLYYMVVGTWKIDIDRKKKAVSNSNLPDEQKEELILLIDKVQQNANDGVYENSDANHYVGMFGAGFQSVVGAAKIKINNQRQIYEWNQQIRDFISMLIDIRLLHDDEKIFVRVEGVFRNGVRGLQAGTASQILHCLKPNTFPILNSVGRKGYSTLGVFLQNPSELKNYIINCRSIKRFRDANFEIKNYRTFDKLFWEVVGKINFEGIIKFLRDYGGKRISVSASNHDKLKNLGQNATDEFKKFCQMSFDKNTFGWSKKVTWQNSGKIREYLWYTLKYEKQKNLPYSISISLEKVQGEFKLIVKLELEKGRTPNEREMFNTVAIASELNGDVKYILYPESVSGGEILNKSEAIAKLKSHNSDRVCPVFVLSDPYIMSRTTEIADEAIEAVDALTPLYDALVKGNIPTKAENEDEQVGDNEVGSNKIMPKNIILYGPPGTGKTYNTVRKAVEIIEPDKGWGDKDYKAVKEEYDKLLNDGRINFVTFHQSYGYEEFVQGIKPVVDDKGNVTYEVQDGIFKEFCEQAKQDKANRYVFIIDEINRGNISKIFGELITLIEDNKRDGASKAMKATLPYKKDGESVSFSVPDNVYIIGTMNTADRSIAAIDTALRRRFTFIEMMPEPEKVLVKDNKHICVGDIDIVEMLKTMNERIAVLYDCEHTIGHAYFMPLKDNPSIDLLADIFRNKIIPLLQEYFYEDYGKIRLVLGDNRKVENLQFIKSKDIDYSDLFGNTDEYELGERSKKYFINNDAFSDQQAYIGIYDPTNA